MTATADPQEDRLKHPWFTIWIRPRATIQQLLDQRTGQIILVWAALAGAFEVLNRASTRATGDELDLGAILLIALIVGPAGGVLSLFLGSALIRWTGSWLGGRATYDEVCAAMAWSFVPYLWVSLLWIPELLIFGHEMFTTEMPTITANPSLGYVLLAMGLIQIAGWVWSFVVLLKCVGQVQGFSAWRAWGSIILAGSLIVIPLILFVLALVWMGSS